MRTTSRPLRMPESARILIWPFDRVSNGRQGAGRGQHAIELAAAVVGDDDAVGTEAHRILASSGSRMPLMTMGPFQNSRIHSRSFHEMEGSKLAPS